MWRDVRGLGTDLRRRHREQERTTQPLLKSAKCLSVLCSPTTRPTTMAHHPQSSANPPRPPGNQPFHPIGSVEDMFDLFSDNPADYTIGQHIGFGASSVVYTAVYRRPNGSTCPCALKVLDLDNLPPHALRLLRRETQLMSLSKHPNVLRVRGSWMDGHKLYIALRLMNSGSASDVMRYAWPGGMEEDVVKCILKQALEGLKCVDLLSACVMFHSPTHPYSYLHINGFIHRDIKAANLLIDDDGTVLLGDLGVSTSLSDDEPTQSSRATRRTARHSQDIGADPGRPALTPIRAKRRSFVGTVSTSAMPRKLSSPHRLTWTISALLDGTRTHIGQAI